MTSLPQIIPPKMMRITPELTLSREGLTLDAYPLQGERLSRKVLLRRGAQPRLRTPSHENRTYEEVLGRGLKTRESLLSWRGRSPTRPVIPVIRVLERYHGNVERVANGVASLTLEDDRGRLSEAELTLDQMTQFGLSLTEDFECRVTEQGNEVRVTFTPLPRVRFSHQEETRLRDETAAALSGLDDDF